MPYLQLFSERWEALFAAAARRPRLVIAAGAAMGISLAMLVTITRLPAAAPAPAAAAVPTAAPVRARAELDPLAVISAYNAASIAAAATGDASLVLPFFVAGSREPEAIRAEFTRRAARNEQHEAALLRWGVAEEQISAGSATIETQEVWDDLVFRDGTRVDSRRGTMLRIRYTLSRAGITAPWRIQSIHSTTVMP